jgi:drug/metabolite transporter (DMT)-like permease
LDTTDRIVDFDFKPDGPKAEDTRVVLAPATGSDTFPATEPTVAPAHQKAFQIADLMVLACVTMWAFNVPLVKSILQYMQPLETSLIRFGTAGIIFAVYVKLKEGSLKIKWQHLPLMIGAALMGIFLNQVLFVYALSNTTSSEVSLLMAATPSFATIFAWLMGQEKIRLNYWLSLPLAVAGVSLIILTAPGAKLGGNLAGDGLAILTAASWAAYTAMIRPLMKHYSASLISVYVSLIGSAALLPFALGQLDFNKMSLMPANAWIALVYSTLGAVVVTNLLWFTGIKELGAPRTAFYAYLQPFVGVFAAALILGETIVPWQIAGGFFIVGSMIIYRVKFSRRRKPASEPVPAADAA